MNSLKDFFSKLNDVSFEYVVLRNWDSLPYDVTLGEHSDLDLLVYDFEHFRELFPQAKLESPYPRVRMRIPIADSYIYMDVRHLGDDYYPEDFERAILKTRELNPLGFYTPDALHHRIALAYHAVHHKNEISKDYRRWLGNVTVTELLEVLKQSSVGWVEPRDKSVGRFNGYFKGCTAIVDVREGGEFVNKKQVSYIDYPLLQNEYNILNTIMKSRHFPIYPKMLEEGVLQIQNCGEPVTVENLPDDWKQQLQEILDDLKEAGVQHRDIRLENILVNGKCLKLIDFGWAIFTHPTLKNNNFFKIEHSAPSCLGFPNKPSDSFDDTFSMGRVIKQLDFMLEERGITV